MAGYLCYLLLTVGTAGAYPFVENLIRDSVSKTFEGGLYGWLSLLVLLLGALLGLEGPLAGRLLKTPRAIRLGRLIGLLVAVAAFVVVRLTMYLPYFLLLIAMYFAVRILFAGDGGTRL